MARRGNLPTNPNVRAMETKTGSLMVDHAAEKRERRARPAVGGKNFIVAQTQEEIPPYPPSLKEGGRGQEYWNIYWTHAADWLAMTDLPAVTRLCELWDTYAAIMSTMATEGYTIKVTDGRGQTPGARGKQGPHPVWPTMNHLLQQMERIEGDLGFNPVDRSRIRVERGERGSPLDEWRSTRASRKTTSAA